MMKDLDHYHMGPIVGYRIFETTILIEDSDSSEKSQGKLFKRKKYKIKKNQIEIPWLSFFSVFFPPSS